MHVAHLRLCAVKGTRHLDHAAIDVTPAGVRGDREFALVDPADHRVLTTVQHPRLTRVVAGRRAGALHVVLPDGSAAAQPVADGPSIPVTYWGRNVDAVLQPGPASDALAAYLGRPAVLARTAGPGGFVYGQPVGLWFTAELDVLARRLATELDPRRFRLALGVEGAAPEDPLGAVVRAGTAVLRVQQPITRCPIVDWGVDSAAPDLDLLARLRAGGRTPVFGYGCSVLRAGGVRAGDPVSLGSQP